MSHARVRMIVATGRSVDIALRDAGNGKKNAKERDHEILYIYC
jgi:hypothetical protein